MSISRLATQPAPGPRARAIAEAVLVNAQVIKEHIDKLCSFILANADHTRDDRLWPADQQIFGLNPLSLAHGACGTALFLHAAMGQVPRESLDWIVNSPVSIDAYPPGLSTGLAGIAYTLWELGQHERAEEVMSLCRRSPLRLSDPGLMWGAAGWGIVALRLYQDTGKDAYLDAACEAGEYLVSTGIREDDAMVWRTPSDSQIHFGYGHGGAGIASFLVLLGDATGDDVFHATAQQAMAGDLRGGLPQRIGIHWPRYRGDQATFPYFIHGTSGVGTVLIRNSWRTGWEAHGERLAALAEDSFCVWSILPSLFDGLSGVGEFMLDLHRLAGDPLAEARVHRIAKSVLMYGVERPGGIAYPGRWLERLATDASTGSAGIGFFLLRLHAGGPRFLVDFGVSPEKLQAMSHG
ncbi:MAG: kinase domain protein [Gemmatimonadetes bacterium]|nr:kinase domain protein [Gemmatimonadota bacterium]